MTKDQAHTDGRVPGAGSSTGEPEAAMRTVTSELKKAAREAAISVLEPKVRTAVTGLAIGLAAQAPGFYKQYIEPIIEDAGGLSELSKRFTGQGDAKRTIIGEVIRRTENKDDD